jgi:putative endonuclease
VPCSGTTLVVTIDSDARPRTKQIRLRLLQLQSFIDRLDRAAARHGREAPHRIAVRRGERAAFFHLRRLVFVVTARSWRSAKARGDLELVAWENDVLRFIEVKTHTARAVAPAEAAANAEKRMLGKMAQYYLRQWSQRDVPIRFDTPSIYFEAGKSPRLSALSRRLRLGMKACAPISERRASIRKGRAPSWFQLEILVIDCLPAVIAHLASSFHSRSRPLDRIYPADSAAVGRSFLCWDPDASLAASQPGTSPSNPALATPFATVLWLCVHFIPGDSPGAITHAHQKHPMY